MKNNILKSIVALSVVIAISSGCRKLDFKPTNDKTADDIYATAGGYKSAFAKVYSSMQNTGNIGGADDGSRDISKEVINDVGSSDFLRQLWYLQCLSTDEAGWTFYGNTDPLGIHQMSWSSSNATVSGLFYRIYFQITLANDFIRQSSDENLAKRGITGTDADEIRVYKAEARFLRAYQYWVLMDLFGNVPFATDALEIGSGTLPSQIKRADLFNYVTAELKEISPLLKAPKTNQYGRVDRGAAWALLSRAYLNAGVYTGTEQNDSCIAYSKKLIAEGGYSLHPNYKELMLADNHLNTDEFIYAIPYDGIYGQNYGGTTFLCHGPVGVPGSVSGTNGSWQCIRITQQFVGSFDSKDIRGQFYDGKYNKPDDVTGKVDSQLINMTILLGESKYGYSSFKYRNTTRATTNDPKPYTTSDKLGQWYDVGGKAAHADPAGNFSDVDFPLFRLAEVYLNFAEAVVRRGASGADNNTALDYLNLLSKRARPTDPNGNTIAELTLPYILAERGREMMWECCRRTDLIRFNKFTTNDYLWAWKGGTFTGTSVEAKYNLFPIPSTELSSNPNIKQNTGY